MRGEAIVDTAADFETVTVTNGAFVSSAFFDAMKKELLSAGIGVCRLCDSVETEVTAGLILPSRGVRIVATEDGECGERNFNLTRFMRRDELAKTKSRRSFSRKCAGTLLDGALTALADAGECHFALEDIYVEAMDFGSLTAASDDLISEALAIAADR